MSLNTKDTISTLVTKIFSSDSVTYSQIFWVFAFPKPIYKNHIFILGSPRSGHGNKETIAQLQNIMTWKMDPVNSDDYNSTNHFQSTIWLWFEYHRLVGFILVYDGDDETIMPEANVLVFLKRF